jgi:5'(3')-deoxyribonucleotidase
MKTIYFDMDGVLADFKTCYISKYNDNEFKYVGKNWYDITNSNFFESLNTISEGVELLNFCLGLNVNVEILSTVTTLNTDNVILHKVNWLSKNIINLKYNFVLHNIDKAKFASNNTLLIDDRDICITPFIEKGGNAIKFSPITLPDIKIGILNLI